MIPLVGQPFRLRTRFRAGPAGHMTGGLALSPNSVKHSATPELERRVLWDYRTGQQLADWIPESQKWQYPIGDMKLERSNRFAFAISPTGRYIAEGGNGVLRLYDIEPQSRSTKSIRATTLGPFTSALAQS